MAGAKMENGEWTDSVGNQRVNLQSFRKVIVLNNHAGKQLPCELVVQTRPDNVSGEEIDIGLPVSQSGIIQIGRNGHSVSRTNAEISAGV